MLSFELSPASIVKTIDDISDNRKRYVINWQSVVAIDVDSTPVLFAVFLWQVINGRRDMIGERDAN